MPASSVTSKSKELKPWNSPHLLTSQFQLFNKFIQVLNSTIPPEKDEVKPEQLKELELKIINAFSHKMMPAWLAVAKSYYSFCKKSDSDNALIESLEQQLNIKVKNFESLSALIKQVFLIKYPRVSKAYQPLIDNIATAMAKLTAVALSTPTLLDQAHERDKDGFEGAGPSMSNCISPIETILRNIMGRAEVDKPVIIAATSLLLQVKAVKSHFEQITLINQLEHTLKEKALLQDQIENGMSEDQKTNLEQSKIQADLLQAWQSEEEQLASVKVSKLRKKINQYSDHLNAALLNTPKDEVAAGKRVLVNVMKTALDKEDVLPSERLKTFKEQLNAAVEPLKHHRDPVWMRFVRDCLRIMALTFSGVALYRTLTGQPVNFFKPSHGQTFVEEANRITAAP